MSAPWIRYSVAVYLGLLLAGSMVTPRSASSADAGAADSAPRAGRTMRSHAAPAPQPAPAELPDPRHPDPAPRICEPAEAPPE